MRHTHPRFWISLFLTVFSIGSWANDKVLDYAFPMGTFFANAVGIVYPCAPVAAIVNPSTLPYFGKTGVLSLANAPTIQGATGYGLYASAAKMGRTFGVGAGYVGEVTAKTTHGFFAGAGASLGALALGVAASQTPGAKLDVDASLVIPMQKKLRFAAVVNKILLSPQATVGVGLKDDHYLFEFNIQIPPLNSLASGYSFLAGLGFLINKATVYGSVAYQTALAALTYSGGLGYKLNATVSIMTQYSSSGRLAIATAIEI